MDFEEYLLHPMFIATVYLLAGHLKWNENKFHHAIPRFFMGIWFTILWIHPDIVDAFTQRVVGRWLVLLVGMMELYSFTIKRFEMPIRGALSFLKRKN